MLAHELISAGPVLCDVLSPPLCEGAHPVPETGTDTGGDGGEGGSSDAGSSDGGSDDGGGGGDDESEPPEPPRPVAERGKDERHISILLKVLVSIADATILFGLAYLIIHLGPKFAQIDKTIGVAVCTLIGAKLSFIYKTLLMLAGERPGPEDKISR